MFDAALAMLGMAIYIVIVAAVEVAFPIGPTVFGRWRGMIFSLFNIAAAVFLAAAFARLWSRLGIKPFLTVDTAVWLGAAGAVAASVLFADFLSYWNHRFQHRFLWRIHRLHHCQTELHAANAYAHFSERLLRDMLFIGPLSFVSISFPAVPFGVIIVREALELYIHSPTRIHFGPLARVLVDNRFHRIHHSLDERHFNKNFGIAFSFWDRLFGTAHEPEPGEWPETGVAGIQPPKSLMRYVVFPVLSLDQSEGEALPPLRGLRS